MIVSKCVRQNIEILKRMGWEVWRKVADPFPGYQAFVYGRTKRASFVAMIPNKGPMSIRELTVDHAAEASVIRNWINK